jgi:hypothetical protein
VRPPRLQRPLTSSENFAGSNPPPRGRAPLRSVCWIARVDPRREAHDEDERTAQCAACAMIPRDLGPSPAPHRTTGASGGLRETQHPSNLRCRGRDTLKSAICNPHSAIRTLQSAIRTLQSAICDLHLNRANTSGRRADVSLDLPKCADISAVLWSYCLYSCQHPLTPPRSS